ncbi:hypothetical protein KPATCC21470_0582 [Kitasatospora purpeofusca]
MAGAGGLASLRVGVRAAPGPAPDRRTRPAGPHPPRPEEPT